MHEDWINGKKRKGKKTWRGVYRSMLNCVNALEGHVPPAESAALMVAEEKPRPDTCKAPVFNHHKSL